MAMRIQVLEVRVGDGSLGSWDLGRQCKEAQKEEQQSIMVSLGVSRVHFNAIRGCGSLVGDFLLTKNGPGWMTASPLISIERTKLRSLTKSEKGIE
jgi:hypothetical protein